MPTRELKVYIKPEDPVCSETVYLSLPHGKDAAFRFGNLVEHIRQTSSNGHSLTISAGTGLAGDIFNRILREREGRIDRQGTIFGGELSGDIE